MLYYLYTTSPICVAPHVVVGAALCEAAARGGGCGGGSEMSPTSCLRRDAPSAGVPYERLEAACRHLSLST